MSTAVMEWARRQLTGDPRRKFLLMTLANYADQDGYAWPSMARLEVDTEMTPQAINIAIRDLAEQRLIARHPDAGPGRLRYRVDVIKLRPTDDDDPALLCALADTPKPAAKAKAKREKVERATQEQFDVFWRNYPNQIGQGAARKKFFSAINSGKVTWEAMRVGLERYINKADDRPWCLPATWLEQERWSDGKIENGGVVSSRGPSRPAI